jgi:hypothetical protein
MKYKTYKEWTEQPNKDRKFSTNQTSHEAVSIYIRVQAVINEGQ